MPNGGNYDLNELWYDMMHDKEMNWMSIINFILYGFTATETFTNTVHFWTVQMSFVEDGVVIKFITPMQNSTLAGPMRIIT